MTSTLPDPIVTAAREAEQINTNRDAFTTSSLDRLLRDDIHVDRDAFLDGLVKYHRERMERAPSAATYPEAPAWVEFVRTVDREVQARTGLSDVEMAIMRSRGTYRSFRSHVVAPNRTVERCRVAYIPDTDQGPVHIKNVDDPLTWWKPAPPPTECPHPIDRLAWDGTGSGLHLDTEPPEIFPLPVRMMCHHHCDDVPGAVAFLERYCYFLGQANVLLRDASGRSAAVEKCSYNFIQVYPPDRHGRSHISGMVCRDPESPIGRHQAAMRKKYLAIAGEDENGSDARFWRATWAMEQQLAAFLERSGPVPVQDVFDLFTRPRPEGFNKANIRYKDDPSIPADYTLTTHATLLAKRRYHRWQRSADGASFSTEPEILDF